MLQRFLLIWLIGLSLLAFAWPSFVSSLPSSPPIDPFLWSGPYLPALIALTMFAIGLMLPRDEVSQVLRRWPTVLLGTTLQYTCMPLVAYAVAKILRLEGDHFVGMIMVGCVPGAMASNVLTLNAQGNTSYSVSLTTTATLLSPFVVPLVLQLALMSEKGVRLDPIRTSQMLFLTVVGPVLAGHWIGRRLPDREEFFRRCGVRVANLAILWIIAVVVAHSRTELSQFQAEIVFGLLLVNLVGYCCGYAGGWSVRLPEPMRRALTLEVGMQNAGLGATLATQLFPDQHAIAIAPAMYTFGCMLTGTILAKYWSGRAPSEAKEGE